MRKILTLLVLGALLAIASPAMADEWTVTKLRGAVQLLLGETWIDLKRGDIIPNDKTVRTLEDGRADLQRGQEIIRLGVSTQITINDKTGAIYTIVHQDFGRVEVEAEVRNVEHFAVENRYLAAVVKGTHFIVDASGDSASVSVDRGAVAVESVATLRRTTIGVGQTVSVEPATDMRLGGTGAMPAIYNADGVVFQAAGSGDTAIGGDSSPEIRTAMLASPANSADVLALRGSGGNGGAAALPAPTAASANVETPPINSATLLIGLLLGVVIGALALMLRRSV